MRTIQQYYQGKHRNPTDIELEMFAQTWSEHCAHRLFKSPTKDMPQGFYSLIQRATHIIRKQQGDQDVVISAFKDNAGIRRFNNKWYLVDKAETHNSPSAFNPFAGAETGILGVNRDILGAGLGAKSILNSYAFGVGKLTDTSTYFRNFPNDPLLSPKQTLAGVVGGVRQGGNLSGIPTVLGKFAVDFSYRGKPLVFVRTVGLLPKEVAHCSSHEKGAEPNDYIVMVGGRVGKDGIHGATFSSEILNEHSPTSAVQIGDPFTQKKMNDAILEAREKGLFNDITDNGAGGLSCSVGEMAQSSNGCDVDLSKVPLKYQGLAPWEIWISESQERMTLAIPPSDWNTFSEILSKHDVEATIIGTFNDSGNCVVQYDNKTIVDLELDFLHHSFPLKRLKTEEFQQPIFYEPILSSLHDSPSSLTDVLYSMLSRPNITSFEKISQQFDHEVQGGSVLKPLQGKGRVNGDVVAVRPVLDAEEVVIVSQDIAPRYGLIDPYHMAANSIDTAIRNVIVAGGSLEHITLMDNFCWSKPEEPRRVAQLTRAVQACYDYAVGFGTPFISGKDSMYNDFSGYDAEGNPVDISVLPTLLISSLTVAKNAHTLVSLDAKQSSDLVYVLGETHEELGGSEYFALCGEEERGKPYVGNTVPSVDVEKNKKLYQAFSQAVEQNLVNSSQSVHKGGLSVALSKKAIGGTLGLSVSLQELPRTTDESNALLFSESAGRILVTVPQRKQKMFEDTMKDNPFACIGYVTDSKELVIQDVHGTEIINEPLDLLASSYKTSFGGNL